MAVTVYILRFSERDVQYVKLLQSVHAQNAEENSVKDVILMAVLTARLEH